MKRSVSNPDKHLQHQVDVVLTPDLNHYSKLICRDCGGAWIQWLGRTETETLIGPQAKKQQQPKTKSNWSNIQPKERQHYQSFQPPRQLKNTQLIGDRLALRGRSQYNGNPIGSIPIRTLKSILKTQIDNPSDRQYIEQFIQKISGPEPGPSVAV